MTAAATYRAAVGVVAASVGSPVHVVLAPRGRQARRHRHLAAYLAHVGGGVPLRQLAPVIGCYHRHMRRHVHRIEDARDDPAFDDHISRLEARLEARLGHRRSPPDLESALCAAA